MLSQQQDSSHNINREVNKRDNAIKWVEYVKTNKAQMRKPGYVTLPDPEIVEREQPSQFDFEEWLIRYKAEPEPNFHYLTARPGTK